ncbi:hypothetical protein [Sphingobacterium corticibacter]|nr:hypothetical protein [Sphingobacterium corticibacter]
MSKGILIQKTSIKAQRYVCLSIMRCALLFFIILFSSSFATAQEKRNALKIYQLNDTISNLFTDEIDRLNIKGYHGDYLIVNYNKSKNQIKMTVLDKHDFAEVLILFGDIIIGLTHSEGRSFAFLGDSYIFLKELSQFQKIDEYELSYKMVNQKKATAFKKQGLINFPTTQDSYSLFYHFDGDNLVYRSADMVLVFDDTWL